MAACSGSGAWRSVNAPNTAPRRGIFDVHPNPDNVRRGQGGGTLRGAFSGSLCGLKLVPAKWHRLNPPMLRNTPKGHTLCRVLRKRQPLGGLHITLSTEQPASQ